MRTIAPEGLQRGRSIRLAALPLPLVASFVASFAVSLGACEAPRGTIGAVIAQDGQTGRLFVRDVPPGLAADRAGIKRGDEILLIDGLDARSMSSQQIHAALSGDVDAPVKLTLARSDQQVLRVTVKRTEARKLIKHRAAEE